MQVETALSHCFNTRFDFSLPVTSYTSKKEKKKLSNYISSFNIVMCFCLSCKAMQKLFSIKLTLYGKVQQVKQRTRKQNST